MKKIELGISTFGETTPLENTGKAISHEERIRNLIEEIKLADEVGLDVYAIGEHHRKDFAVSSPEIILAAASMNTKNIKLSSATTNISTNDPIRVYQNFASIDALSKGRAEIMVGRSSFTEAFHLFGYNLSDFKELFEEKLNMLLEIRDNEILNWSGKFTPTVKSRGVYPRANNLDIWVASGGSAESTIRTARQGLPIVYAIIGGNPLNFKYLINTYRKLGKEYGHSEEKLKVATHSWGFIADNNEEAIKKYYYPTKVLVDQISTERAHWSKFSYEKYLREISDEGAMFVGDPTNVANKIIKFIETLNIDRFILHLPVGSMEHKDTLRAIELFGKEVAPKVKKYFEKSGEK